MVEGDGIVEIGPDGTFTPVWSVWDHLEYDPGMEVDPGAGWSHANALQYDKTEDVYYLSLRNFDSILKIDRATGEVLWTLGGQHSDFTLANGDKRLFQHQHQFRILDGGVLVFDNGTSEQFDSRVVEYALDEDQGRAELAWEHHDEPPVHTLALGDVERLENGNTLISWGAVGQVDDVTPEGERVWRLHVEIGHGFGYTIWREVLYDTVSTEFQPVAR